MIAAAIILALLFITANALFIAAIGWSRNPYPRNRRK